MGGDWNTAGETFLTSVIRYSSITTKYSFHKTVQRLSFTIQTYWQVAFGWWNQTAWFQMVNVGKKRLNNWGNFALLYRNSKVLVDGRNRMSSLIPDIAASSRWAEWWQALECRGCEMSVRAKVVDSHVRMISHKECPLEIKQRRKHCPSRTPSIRPSSSRFHLITAVKWVEGWSWGPPHRLTLRHNTWLLDYFWIKLTFLAKRLCIQPCHVQVLLFHSSISSSRLSKLWS